MLLLGYLRTLGILSKGMGMYKIVRGKKARQFGQVEWLMSMNWGSLLTALAMAALSWLNSEGLPVMQEHGALSAGLAAALALGIPMIMNWLKDNSTVAVEKEVKAPSSRPKV